MKYKDLLQRWGTFCNPRLYKYCSSPGFSLLEIMIALAIIGAVLTVIIHTTNYQADISFENTVTTRMFQLAKEKLTEMESNPINTKGTFADSGFSFTTTVKDIGEPGIVEIISIVSDNEREIALSELIIRK